MAGSSKCSNPILLDAAQTQSETSSETGWLRSHADLPRIQAMITQLILSWS